MIVGADPWIYRWIGQASGSVGQSVNNQSIQPLPSLPCPNQTTQTQTQTQTQKRTPEPLRQRAQQRAQKLDEARGKGVVRLVGRKGRVVQLVAHAAAAAAPRGVAPPSPGVDCAAGLICVVCVGGGSFGLV